MIQNQHGDSFKFFALTRLSIKSTLLALLALFAVLTYTEKAHAGADTYCCQESGSNKWRCIAEGSGQSPDWGDSSLVFGSCDYYGWNRIPQCKASCETRNTPSCSQSTTTENASCSGAGYQNGTMSRTVTTNSCTGTTYGGWNTGGCGCNSGYSWNGSSCVSNCSPSSYTETQSCGGGYQTGSMSRTVTNNCPSGQSVSGWNMGGCGCYGGYSWNGSSCVQNCSTSSYTENQSCGGGYQTGTRSRTVTTNSCGGTSYSGWDSGSCGCYGGYSWNGSSCVPDVAPENGSCGSSTNSCNSGTFSDATDSSTAYLWNCYGIAGGSSTGCSRARPGQCGFASGGTYSSAPSSSTALCALGTSSSVTGPSNGPWAWTCSTGGGSANCASNYCAPPVNGACDTSTINGCSKGNLVDLADNSSSYVWQCQGLNGGTDSPQCLKAKPPVLAGSCGPSLNTCASGTFSDTADNSANYNWQCLGSNGGATVDCAQAKPPSYTYGWAASGFGSCSASCGGGTQSQSVSCQRSDGQTVSDGNCSGGKPSTSQSCNTQACAPTYTYGWAVSGFGSCSASCGGGTQTQSVSCQRSDGQTVSDGNCSGGKPATSQSCNTQACAPTYTYGWAASGFGSCSASCGGGTQTQSVTCQRSDGQTVSDGNCSGGKPSTSQSCNTQACAQTCTWAYATSQCEPYNTYGPSDSCGSKNPNTDSVCYVDTGMTFSCGNGDVLIDVYTQSCH